MGKRMNRNWIALTLAIGLCTAMNIFTAAVLYDAINNPDHAGLSENATQILTGWGGGIIGVIGALFGYDAGRKDEAHADTPTPTEQDPDA